MNPMISSPTMTIIDGTYNAAPSIPAFSRASKIELMMSGPAMPAADHAVSRRP